LAEQRRLGELHLWRPKLAAHLDDDREDAEVELVGIEEQVKRHGEHAKDDRHELRHGGRDELHRRLRHRLQHAAVLHEPGKHTGGEEEPGLRSKQIGDPTFTRSVSIIKRSGRTLPPLNQGFIEYLGVCLSASLA
jgi:hypothetical protein